MNERSKLLTAAPASLRDIDGNIQIII